MRRSHGTGRASAGRPRRRSTGRRIGRDPTCEVCASSCGVSFRPSCRRCRGLSSHCPGDEPQRLARVSDGYVGLSVCPLCGFDVMTPATVHQMSPNRVGARGEPGHTSLRLPGRRQSRCDRRDGAINGADVAADLHLQARSAVTSVAGRRAGPLGWTAGGSGDRLCRAFHRGRNERHRRPARRLVA